MYALGAMSIETEQDLDGPRRAGRVVAETIAEVKARLRWWDDHGPRCDTDRRGRLSARHGARSAPRDERGVPRPAASP